MSHAHPAHEDIVYPSAIPFALLHLSALAVLWTGVTTRAVVIAVVLYVVRMWAITAGYHRYFSHRSFRTSRAFQFVLAFLAQSSTQKGVLWWADVHRTHHKHSDTPEDVHSPRRHGLLFAHFGWLFVPSVSKREYTMVADLQRFPELVWLDRWSHLPSVALGALALALGGWPGLVVGFVISTIVLDHATFAINSLAHTTGKQRYLTGDDSRNNWWLAILTLGEGWHNNHHHYQVSARQGFRWYEVDPTFWSLKLLSWIGVVGDLKLPPPEVVRDERAPSPRVVERALALSRELGDNARRLPPAVAARLAELREAADEQGSLVPRDA